MIRALELSRTRPLHAAALVLSIAAVLAATFAQLWIPLGSPVPGEFSDSIDYLLFADYFRGAFSAALTDRLTTFFAVTRFPPLYPLALEVVGAGIRTPMPAYWLNAAFMIASVALSIRWLSLETGSAFCGACLGALLAATPGLILLAMNPASEPMFIFLLLIALLWARRIENRQDSLIAFAAFVGLVPLCRMAGIVLPLAVAAWLLLRRVGHPRDRAVMLIVMGLPAIAWVAYRQLLPIAESYGSALAPSRMLAAFGGWEGWALGQPRRMITGYLDALSPAVPPSAGLVLASLLGAGFLLRLRRRTLDALFFGLYLLLVFCWPYPREIPRLMIPTVPLLFLYAWEAMRAALHLIGRERWPANVAAAAALVASFVAVSGPFLRESVTRACAPVEPELAPFKRKTTFFHQSDRQAAFEHLEVDARIDAMRLQTGAIVQAGQCVFAFFPNALIARAPEIDARTMPYPADPRVPLRDQLAGCNYLLVTIETSVQLHQPLLYPMREAAAFTRPELVSSMSLAGRTSTIAALLKRSE